MTRTPCGECFVESLVPKKIGTDTVIFHIHGGSFKIKLIDAYRRLALKYSRAAGGAAVFSVDYRTMPEYISFAARRCHERVGYADSKGHKAPKYCSPWGQQRRKSGARPRAEAS